MFNNDTFYTNNESMLWPLRRASIVILYVVDRKPDGKKVRKPVDGDTHKTTELISK